MTDEKTFEQDDDFVRKPIAQKIHKLLKEPIDVSPMIIDGGWGTGKSVFCEKLISMINKEGGEFNCIYIDAFKADHVNDPLMTIVAAIAGKLENSKKDEFIKKAIPALRFGSKTLLKAGFSHFLKQTPEDVIEGYEKDVNQAGNKLIDATINSILKDHIQAEENIQTLQTMLKGLADDKEIVVFVDELDRCRPNFAVDTLEIIKHTFDIEGVQFVFVTNMQQMRASVEHCYGKRVDAHRYLDKFVKFTIRLPKIKSVIKPLTSHASKDHFRNLIRQNSVLMNLTNSNEALFKLTDRLIQVHSLSLREIETFVRHLHIYATLDTADTLRGGNLIIDLLILTGIASYSFHPELAEAIYNREVDVDTFLNFIGVQGFTYDGSGRPDEFELLCFIISLNAGVKALSNRLEGKQREFYTTMVHKSLSLTIYDESQNQSLAAIEAIGILKLTDGC